MTCPPARACSRVSGSRFAEPAGTKFQQLGSHRPFIAIASPAKASSRWTDDLNRIGLGRARGALPCCAARGQKNPSAVFLEFRCARLYPTSHAKLVGAVLLAKLMFEIAFLSGNNGIADYEHRWDEHEDRPPAAKHQRECKVEGRGRAVPRVTRKSVWPRGRKRFGGQSGWNGCADLPECCNLPADNC